MKIAMYASGILVAVVVVAGFIVYLVGRGLPVKHSASITIDLEQSDSDIWNRISDMKKGPEWRTSLKSVEEQPARNGRHVWRETNGRGDAIDFETTVSEPRKRLVRTIVTPNLPFGGTWTFALSKTASGSTLHITEDGEVYSPIFRFVSTYLMGHDTTLRAYAEDLRKSFAK